MNPKTKTALIACSAITAVLMLFGPILIGGAVVGSIAGSMAVSEGASNGSDSSDCEETTEKDKDAPDVYQASSVNPQDNQKTFVTKYAKYALEAGKKYNIPPEAILTQAVLESGWGASVPNYNFFGIKAWSGCRSGATTATSEDYGNGLVAETATWCAYDNEQDGYNSYGIFIRNNSRYDNSIAYRADPYKYLETIWKDGYATDPKYLDKVYPILDGIIAVIDETKVIPRASDVKFDELPDVSHQFTNNTDKESSNSDSAERQATSYEQCKAKKTETAAYGDSRIGGAPSDTNNYGWMCAELGVCKNGDYGPVGNISGDYQCVWYAWTRLFMIHRKSKENTKENVNATLHGAEYSGNGGYIADRLKSNPDWIVTDKPKAGDGVSLRGGSGIVQHVAVVEEVKGDTILVSEGNKGGGSWNEYGRNVYRPSDFEYCMFFRYKDW